MAHGHSAAFFTLEYTDAEVEELFRTLGRLPSEFRERWLLDTSEEISAEHIARRLAGTPPRTTGS